MKMNNIQTEFDVIKNSPADSSFSTAVVCNNIPRIERVAFSSCFLGLEMYEALKDDLVDLSEIELYEVKPYNVDEMVIYNGNPYKNTIAGNTDNPDDDGWVHVDKFQDESNNKLWDEGGMKYWLAFLVFHSCVAYGTYTAGAIGTTKVSEVDGQTSITFKEYAAYKSKIKHDADDQLEMLYSYMKLNNMLAESCGSEECKPPKKRRKRRWHFRKND